MQKNKLLLVMLLVGVLAACGSTQPVLKVVTQTVEIPVPVACKEEEPIPPDFCFPQLSEDADIYTKSACLVSDRLKHLAYEVSLLTKLKACK